jgi:hypothetical protein
MRIEELRRAVPGEEVDYRTLNERVEGVCEPPCEGRDMDSAG